MILKKTTFLFLFFYYLFSFSQTINEENLTDSINTNFYSNPKRATELIHTYINRNKKSDNINNLVLAYTSLAISHEVMNNVDSTLFYYYKSVSLLDKSKDIIQYKYSLAKIYRDEYNYKEALLLYNQIYDLARKENMSEALKRVNLTMASMKNGLGQPEETIEKLKSLYITQKKSKESDIRYTRKKIIEAYLLENNIKAGGDLIQEGLEEAIETNNKEFLYYMYYFKSQLSLAEKKYVYAIENATLALENAKPLLNSKFISEANFRLAEIYFETNRFKEALQYLKKLEVLNVSKKAIELSKYYKLTAKTYAKLDSSKASSNYFVKHIKEKEKDSKKRLNALESIYNITLREQVVDIQNSYGLELKEEVLETKKQEKTKWAWAGISFILLLIIVSLFLFITNKSNKNQKRFDDLMVKISAFEERKEEENKTKLNKKTAEESKTKKASVELSQTTEKPSAIKDRENKELEEAVYVIDDQKVQEILNKLQKLENKQYFLRQDCTMHNMAKKLKTNTSYLSKIINTHLEKSFSTYINELRIDYAIIELKNNKRLRSYSVKAIAEEMGYKNADAFSRYFRAETGISPSVYIKKIQNI